MDLTVQYFDKPILLEDVLSVWDTPLPNGVHWKIDASNTFVNGIYYNEYDYERYKHMIEYIIFFFCQYY